MAAGLFKRIGMTAVPANRSGREALSAVTEGETFTAELRTRKNQEQVNLFFALRDLVAEATDTTRDAAKEWLLMKTGFADLVWYPDGTAMVRPRSVAAMSQDAFDQFFHAALPVIQAALGTNRKELLARYFELLDPNTRAAARKRLRRTASPSIAPAESEQETEPV